MTRSLATRCTSLLLPIVMLSVYGTAQKTRSYTCAEAKPAQMCSAANTCGSASTPCSVDIKRTGSGASATPGIPGAKSNSLFCVKAGTTVEWKSTSRNVGFLVDVGTTSPFEPGGAIAGGSAKSTSVVAKTPGCYKYSAGACVSGAIYGMCGDTSAELVIIP
jgi:plastocyanin